MAGTSPAMMEINSRMNTTTPLPAIPLPSGIRSRFVENINGLRMHVLESGFETRGPR